jgi:hypothetical protein
VAFVFRLLEGRESKRMGETRSRLRRITRGFGMTYAPRLRFWVRSSREVADVCSNFHMDVGFKQMSRDGRGTKTPPWGRT